MSAMVRSTATQEKGSLEGILKTLIAFSIAPCAIEDTQPAGELPASMWIIRGGKARIAPVCPCASVRSTHSSK